MADLYQIGTVNIDEDRRPDFKIRIETALVDAGFIIANDPYGDDIHILVYKEEL